MRRSRRKRESVPQTRRHAPTWTTGLRRQQNGGAGLIVCCPWPIVSPGPAPDKAAAPEQEANTSTTSNINVDGAAAAGPVEAASGAKDTPISALSLPALHRPHSKPRALALADAPACNVSPLSRDQSEMHYKEFRKLLFQQDDHKAGVFKAQFRGGNPFIKRTKPKPATVMRPLSRRVV